MTLPEDLSKIRDELAIKSPKHGTFIFVIDAHLSAKIRSLSWQVRTYKNKKQVYAWNSRRIKGKRIYTALHRFITDAPKGMYVDHANGNTLDNRLCNLRVCTVAQNTTNTPKIKSINTTSIYKGVSYDKQNKKWKASIKHKNKNTTIGYFSKELDAAKAYDKTSKELHGQFGIRNFET